MTSQTFDAPVLFDRVVELYVGNFAHGNNPESIGVLVSELDMDFRVERSNVWFENKAVFHLYNASPATINNILYGGSSVVFRAGHRNAAVGTIWIGQIGYAWTERRGLDTVTSLLCTNGRGGQYQLARVKVALSFATGTSLVSIFQDIAAYAGLALGGLRNLEILEITITEPMVLVSDLRRVLDYLNKVVLAEYCLVCYIDNNELLLYRSDGDPSEIDSLLLSPDTGLISVTPYRDEGRNQINYRQDLAYWSGYSKTMDSVVAAEDAVKLARDQYDKASQDAKAAALRVLNRAKENLEKQRMRAQTIKDTGKEPEKEEEIARRKTVQFKAILNPHIVPNSLVNIESGKDGDPLQVRGKYLVGKAVFIGDNFGGDFHVEGEAYA